MRYAKGVIIVGTSILGGVLAGLSIAKIAGLAQFPYGVGMAAGIAILGMLIQFAINKDRYDEEDDEEEDDDNGALPEETRKPAETEPPTEIMLRMTEEAADTVRAALGNEGMQEREADPAMQIRRIMKTMIVLMSRKTGTAIKILKNCSRKDVGWILKIWRILMSRKNMEITGMIRI